MAQKTEVSGIYKVCDGILINKDNEALSAYKRRKQREENIKDISSIKEELSDLKTDIKDIKELLRSLVK